MSDISRRIAGLSPEQRALLERRLPSAAEAAAARPPGEPIAIVGLGCRFPGGASSPEAFWRLLQGGTDAITDVPGDRWNAGALYDPDPAAAGKAATRWGGFLEGVDQFDASFFGISPREAKRMDPQQRLLLEVAWEALEDAGQATERLAGTSAGVFVGIHSLSNDYFLRQAANLRDMDSYTSTGAAHSIVANRLSYLLDLRGPSLAVDTACSSSLVAVHLACQSLRLRECDLALAGGVNLILSPEATVAFSKLQMMARDGRCKTFDARADGFVRSEGCGVVVLRRLSDARRDGDPIVAVIRGTAVNQDGTTNGITAPSGLAQQEVVREALKNGGVLPTAVSFVETHGTGTALGDPIEVESLAEVLGQGGPCLLGAVKSNIGHLEAAAGIASLIKAVLCLRHRYIPPNLHFQRANPHLALEKTRFLLPTRGQPWVPTRDGARVAGVSSFGFGGTNAHVILEEAPAPETAAAGEGEGRALLLPISARSEVALRCLAREYAGFLADSASGGSLLMRDIAYTAAVRRSHHRYRGAVVGIARAEWIRGFDRLARGRIDKAAPSRPGVAFVYSGEGPQWPGMGRELFASEPVFRDAIERCDGEFRKQAGWSLLNELNGPEVERRLHRTDVAQPAIFALQFALTALYRSWGIEPEAVVGHGTGEVAAAHAAGVLGYEDAVAVSLRRGRVMQRAAGRGAMAAVELPLAEAERALTDAGGRVEVAATNSPTSTAIAGEVEALEAVLDRLEVRGVVFIRLGISFAFHSRQMEPLRQELEQALRGVRPSRAVIPIFSTVTGRAAEDGDYGAEYWSRGIRERVRFAEAVTALAQDGNKVFLELSPDPVLAPMIVRCGRAAAGRELFALGALRREHDEGTTSREALGALYRLGQGVDFARCAPSGGRCVPLPRYPWQRSRFWVDAAPPDRAAATIEKGARLSEHPVLGRRLTELATLPGVRAWERRIEPGSQLVLRDYRTKAMAVFSVAAYVEMALAAAGEAFGPGPHVLEQVDASGALLMTGEGPRALQVVLTPHGGGEARFQLFGCSLPDGGPRSWTPLGSGRLLRGRDGASPESEGLDAIRQRCGEELSVTEHFRGLRARGLELGPGLVRLERLRRGRREAFGALGIAEWSPADRDAGSDPSLLQSCFELLRVALPLETGTAEWQNFVPAGLRRFQLHRRLSGRVWAHALLCAQDPNGFEGNVRLLDEWGRVLADGIALRFQPFGHEESPDIRKARLETGG